MWLFAKREKDAEEIESAKRDSDNARKLLRKARDEARIAHNLLMEQTLRGQTKSDS